MAKVVIVSDTHNMAHLLPPLPEGDILIHCGDATTRSSYQEVYQFVQWIDNQPHKHKLFVPGNHDWMLTRPEGRGVVNTLFKRTKVLVNEVVNIEGLVICGVPEDYYLNVVPNGVDILITHYPPEGILDEIPPHSKFNATPYPEHIGSQLVLRRVLETKPRYHLFGHVHENGGQTETHQGIKFFNCACLDEYYQLVRGPTVLTIDAADPIINN